MPTLVSLYGKWWPESEYEQTFDQFYLGQLNLGPNRHENIPRENDGQTLIFRHGIYYFSIAIDSEDHEQSINVKYNKVK